MTIGYLAPQNCSLIRLIFACTRFSWVYCHQCRPTRWCVWRV